MPGQATVWPPEVVFAPGNWNITQTVDGDRDGRPAERRRPDLQPCCLGRWPARTRSTPGWTGADPNLTTIDNDEPGFTFTPPTVTVSEPERR